MSESNRVMDCDASIYYPNNEILEAERSYWRPHEPGDANQHIN